MKIAFAFIGFLLIDLSCTRRLSVSNNKDYRQSDSASHFTDTSHLLVKEKALNITWYGDQLAGNINIPATSLQQAVNDKPVIVDSLESSGLKVKARLTKDSAGNWKIGLEAKAKPVSVTDVKEKQSFEQKGISGATEIKTTTDQRQYNKQVTRTSIPWQVWLLIGIAAILFAKYFLKLF